MVALGILGSALNSAFSFFFVGDYGMIPKRGGT
jgi:hypothetical protein